MLAQQPPARGPARPPTGSRSRSPRPDRAPRARSRVRRSRRAASSAVDRRRDGESTEVAAGRQRPSRARSRPSSTSIESSCSTKSGLPSAALMIVRARRRRRGRCRRAGSRSRARSRPPSSGSSRTSCGVGRLPPSGPRLERDRGALCRAGGAAPRRSATRSLDEIEERRLRPVEVLEHDDERAVARERSSSLRAPQNSSSSGNALGRQPDGARPRDRRRPSRPADERRELRRARRRRGRRRRSPPPRAPSRPAART